MKQIRGIDKVFFFRASEEAGYGMNLLRDDTILLSKSIKGKPDKVLSSRSLMISSENGWYRMRIELLGATIKVYINDILHINAVDADNPILNGRIMLYVWPGAYAVVIARQWLSLMM